LIENSLINSCLTKIEKERDELDEEDEIDEEVIEDN
jgi:hypothetical protein